MGSGWYIGMSEVKDLNATKASGPVYVVTLSIRSTCRRSQNGWKLEGHQRLAVAAAKRDTCKNFARKERMATKKEPHLRKMAFKWG